MSSWLMRIRPLSGAVRTTPNASYVIVRDCTACSMTSDRGGSEDRRCQDENCCFPHVRSQPADSSPSLILSQRSLSRTAHRIVPPQGNRRADLFQRISRSPQKICDAENFAPREILPGQLSTSLKTQWHSLITEGWRATQSTGGQGTHVAQRLFDTSVDLAGFRRRKVVSLHSFS